MNTDIIEGLNDDQIMSLYNDTIVDGLDDGVHTGHCICYLSSSRTYNVFGNSADDGGCYLIKSRLSTEAKCKTWCATYHRFEYFTFNTRCFCTSTGRGVSNFTSCR